MFLKSPAFQWMLGILALFIGIFCAGSAQAQGWKKVATFNGLIANVKFLNSRVGFVTLGIYSVSNSVALYKTTDGGATWVQATIPSGYDGRIDDIDMIDSLHGWIAVADYHGAGNRALWHTTDAGMTWNQTPLVGWGTSVTHTPRAVIITDFGNYFHISTDGGATFFNGPMSSTNCVRFADSLHGVMTVFRGSSWMNSSDGGLTWQNSNFATECWSVYPDSGTPNFYAAPEVSNILYHSTDYGKTWGPLASFPKWTTGTVAGIGDKYLFCQLQHLQTNGMYYSTDKGVSWRCIGGPGPHPDTRFCAIEDCTGGVTVYAFDDQSPGTLYRYSFDTTLTVGSGVPEFSSNPSRASATLCQDTTGGFLLSNNHCDAILILGLTLLDSNSIAFTSGAFGFDSLPKLPLAMYKGSKDSIRYHWNPSGRLTKDTSITLRLKVHYFNSVRDTTADTIVAIELKSTNPANSFSLRPAAINMGTVSSCSRPPDTTVILRNLSCLPLVVDSIVVHGSGFKLLDSILAPIAPDDSAMLHVQFLPVGNDISNGTITFYLEEAGAHIKSFMPFQGQSKQGLGILEMSDTSLQAGSISFCAGDTVLTDTLRNTGCDTLIISGMRLLGDSGFSLVSLPPDSVLLPDSSEIITIQFAPRVKGVQSATLSFHSRNIAYDPGQDTMVTIAGLGSTGATVLDIDTSIRNFGALYACESRDTTITLYNPGCDTSVISGITLSGDSDFSLVSVPADSLVLPDSSETIIIRFSPRGKGTQSAVLSFHSQDIVNDPGRDRIITFDGSGLGGQSALLADTSLRDFGALYPCESRDTTIWLYNPGCDTLTIDTAFFANAAYSADTEFPLMILPDSSTSVRIHLAASSSSMVGKVSFLSNATAGPDTLAVPLTASLLHPATLRLVLSPSDSAAAGQTVTCYILLEGQIRRSLVSALDFDITHDDDLLSFLKASGMGLSIVKTTSSPGIQTQSFSLSPLPASDTVGTLMFQVYLTDSANSPITLSNVTLATTRNLPGDCIASIGDSGAAFAYLYRCGNHILQDKLLTGQVAFRIQRIVPNPASTALTITVSGNRHPGMEYQLFDALGNCVLVQCPVAETAPLQSTNHTVTPVPHTLRLDVSSLPSGIYFLRISSGDYAVSRSVAIER